MIHAGRRLAAAGVDSPQLCARLLVCHLLGVTRLELVQDKERTLSREQADALEQLLCRRIGGEPLAYLLGKKEFFSRDFHVTPDTLIPRPETELLVETVLDLLPKSRKLIFADIGCGCGCLGISLVLECSFWRGVLVDISRPALAVARRNASALRADSNLVCVQADMRSAPLKPSSCDFLVSNPPYIAYEQTGQVMDDVLLFEPHCALFSPCHGTGHLQAVIRLAERSLKRGGMLFVEHGAEQGVRVRAMLDGSGFFRGIRTLRDLAGLERCTLAEKKQD